MSKFTRWIIVDDTSSDINYLGGSWFPDVASWDSIGSYGMTYSRTLHSTSSNASFTFDFTGSAIRVVGSTPGSNNSYWTCLVDGDDTVMRSAVDTRGPPRNNFEFCYVESLDDRQHTLTMRVTPTGNQTFWLDRIEYIPSQQVSIEHKAIGVTLGGPGMDSSALTAFVFTFEGVSVGWYGTIFNSNPGNVSWSMDDEDVNYISNWNIGLSSASYPLQNQKFFETATYPNGAHTLKVSYIGNKSNLQLGFDYLVVQDGTVPSRTTGRISTATTVAKSGVHGHVASGAIVGGVIGGVLTLIGIAVLCFYLCHRRFRSKEKIDVYSDEPYPFDQKPAYISPHTYPVQRKSRLFAIDTPFNANEDHLPDRSHMNQSPPRYEPSASVTNVHHLEDHGCPEPIPQSAQDIVVDVGQGGFVTPRTPLRIVVHQDSGIRLNGEVLATPATNP